MCNDGWIAMTRSWRESVLADLPFFSLDVPGVPVAKGRPASHGLGMSIRHRRREIMKGASATPQ